MATTGPVERLGDDNQRREVETVTFEIGDSAYEIDLTTPEAHRLRALYAQWIPHARKREDPPRTPHADRGQDH